MKRFVVLCLAALVLLSVFCGCENNESETNTTNAECEIVEEGIIACNGVYRNSEVKYAVNKNNELILNVDSWGESFFIPNQDMFFVGETVNEKVEAYLHFCGVTAEQIQKIRELLLEDAPEI